MPPPFRLSPLRLLRTRLPHPRLSHPPQIQTRFLTTTTPRALPPKESSGDYGSGTGDPAGETPEKQGTSSTSRAHEHPGPPSPASSPGKGQGGASESAPPQGGRDTPDSRGSATGGRDEGGSGGRSVGGKGEGGGSASGGGKEGKKSKIASHDISMDADRVESEDVKQHNRDMDKRFDRASERSGDVEDKVDKGFWSGAGGRDGQP